MVAPALLVLLALITLFFRLGSLPLVGADEPRYARIAAEMRASGDWITPHLEGKPWLEKPPLYYWLTIPFYAFTGENETGARAGSALLALASALAVAWLGRRLWSALAGFLAGGVMLTSIGIVAFGRSASTDMPLTSCLTLALALLGGAVLRERQPWWQTLAAWIFLGMAILAKGPVAPLLAAGILGSFWCLDERGGSLRRWLVLPGSALCLAVALPWFWLAWRENGDAFVAIFLVNHNLARYISDLHHHTEPVYYYLPVIAGLVFPWTGWLAMLVKRPLCRRSEWDRRMLFLACWAAFPFVFFSLSRSKLAGYVLPVVPPLALCLGAIVSGWLEGRESGGRGKTAAIIQAALSVGLAVALPVVLRQRYGQGWSVAIPLSAAVALPSLAALAFVLRGDRVRAVSATLCQGAIVVLALVQFAAPALGDYHSARGIAQRLLSVREAGEPAVSFRFFHHSLHYYAGYSLTADLDDIPTLERWLSGAGHLLVVTEVARLPELRDLPSVTLILLGEQGKLRLLRLARH